MTWQLNASAEYKYLSRRRHFYGIQTVMPFGVIINKMIPQDPEVVLLEVPY